MVKHNTVPPGFYSAKIKSVIIDNKGRINMTFKDLKDKPEQKKPLLQRANELISNERQKDYGNKLQNFAQIAMLWQGTLARKLAPGMKITPEDIALCMMQVKIARLTNLPDHEDSILDVAGYAGCYEAVQLERAAGFPMSGATEDYGSTE